LKPQKAFNLIYTKNNRLVYLLVFFFLFQSLIFFISISKFNIPISFINFALDQITNSKDIKLIDVQYQFPNKLFIKSAIYKHKNEHVNFQNIRIVIKTILDESGIDQLSIQKIRFKNSNFKISDLKSYYNKNQINSNFFLSSKFGELKVSGIIDKEHIISHFSKTSIKYYEGIIEEFIEKTTSQSKIELNVDKPTFLVLAVLKNGGEVNIKQLSSNETSNTVTGLSCHAILNKENLNVNKLNIKTEKISVHKASNSIQINGLNFSYKKYLSNNPSDIKDIIKLSFQNLDTKSLLNGTIPNFTLNSSFSEGTRHYNVYSNSNSTKISTNIIQQEDKIKRITGSNLLIPKFLNLRIKAHGSEYNFLDGNKLSFDFYSNVNSFASPLSFIKLKAYGISVLESPPGDYNATGYINSNFSLNINNIDCIMGKSYVTGSYRQEWAPYDYEFILRGEFTPTNINNWLGNWWSKIWQNFKFTENNIPHGDFAISGSWGDKSKNITLGTVNGEKFSYKEFFVNDSKIELLIDDNKTTINANELNHSAGTICGSFTIHDKSDGNDKYFEYSIQGTLPINDCKKVFGPIIEDHLNDINLTTASINSNGYIPIFSNDYNNTVLRGCYYTIDLSTDQNGTWSNVEFNGLKGIISSDFNKTYLKFPSIGFSDGTLSFNLSSTRKNSLLSLKFELLKASIKKVITSFYNFQNYNNLEFKNLNDFNFISDKGVMNLKLNANGSANNFTSFKGTGKISAKDRELSKLQLLGFLSKGLSEIPIPFPTGTLNFDKLEGLFEVDNDKLQFDQLILSGLLSKVENRGTFNFINGELNIISKVQLIGNLPIPFIKQFAQIADPLSAFAEIRVTGTWKDPQWKILLKQL
jgi:hypothetical protein